MISDREIIESIRDGEEKGLIQIYKEYRSEFVQWVTKKYGIDPSLADDGFQEAILALRFNIIHGRLQQLSSTLKTYLFSIGKNQVLGRLKKSKYELSSDNPGLLASEVWTSSRRGELSDRQRKVRDSILKMEEPCKTILRMFYYLGYSMDVIAARMEYKSKDVAKTQKSRCLKKLKGSILSA